jgi:hypothetical protein
MVAGPGRQVMQAQLESPRRGPGPAEDANASGDGTIGDEAA